MPAIVTPIAVRHHRRRALLVALLGLMLLTACASSSGSGTAAKLLEYQRVWPDGRIEAQTIHADGRIEMTHGEMLERLTISPTDVSRITDALAREIPVGSPDDSPKRTLTLPNGTVIEAPRPDPGTVTELLEQLLDNHRLS